MNNPWLEIPAQDYEGHMSDPNVGQLQVLNQLFGDVIKAYLPPSLAVLGCTTGNGFEHLSPAITKRVIGVDINPDYLSILNQRYSETIPELTLIQDDFTSSTFHIEPVSMIYGALVFEYVDVEKAISRIADCLEPAGMLIAALQQPSEDSPPVSHTKYGSLSKLESIMELVDSESFEKVCREHQLLPIESQIIPFLHGKSLYVGYYRRE